MILRPEYRALAESAAAAGLMVEAGVELPNGVRLTLVVTALPFRFAPLVAAYPPGQWLPRGTEESLTDYARHVWPVLERIQHAALRAGILAFVVSVDDCRNHAAEVVERIVAIRDVVVCFAQGLPESDAIARALTEAMASAGEPAV